jgi:hypothetical protein
MPATWNGILSISLFRKGAESLSLPGLAWPVEVRSHPRARSVRLRLDEGRGRLLLTHPRKMSRKAALEWAGKQSEWVEAQLAAILPAEPFLPNATIPVEGQSVRLYWNPSLPRTPRLADGVLSCGGSRRCVRGKDRALSAPPCAEPAQRCNRRRCAPSRCYDSISIGRRCRKPLGQLFRKRYDSLQLADHPRAVASPELVGCA